MSDRKTLQVQSNLGPSRPRRLAQAPSAQEKSAS